jgi:hypothetical protein
LTGLQESLGRQQMGYYSQMANALAQQQALAQRQYEMITRASLERSRQNAARRYYGGYGRMGGFQAVPSAYAPLAGSLGSLIGSRAYRRINF